MSVYLISVRGGRKVALPVLTEESYCRLRNTSSQQANLRQARMGNQAAKRRLIQFNYSGYYPDGVVKGCRLPSQAFGFDVDDAGEFERIAKMLMEKRGPAMESQGTGTQGDRREKREREKKKLELKNLGTSAGYGYLPVAQARYRELQRARQGIYHLQPGFARLGILYHTGTHIFLQRFRQTEHG